MCSATQKSACRRQMAPLPSGTAPPAATPPRLSALASRPPALGSASFCDMTSAPCVSTRLPQNKPSATHTHTRDRGSRGPTPPHTPHTHLSARPARSRRPGQLRYHAHTLSICMHACSSKTTAQRTLQREIHPVASPRTTHAHPPAPPHTTPHPRSPHTPHCAHLLCLLPEPLLRAIARPGSHSSREKSSSFGAM